MNEDTPSVLRSGAFKVFMIRVISKKLPNCVHGCITLLVNYSVLAVVLVKNSWQAVVVLEQI